MPTIFHRLSVLLLFPLSVFAQSSPALPQTLLWRINSRNGLRPSYLYGTIHITDERVFNLGDSLYAAIHNSDGFATEVDAGEMTALLMQDFQKKMEDARNIKSLLTDKEFSQYAPELARRLGKPQDQITTSDISKLKNKWMMDSYKTGKMQTFLDAYLYDLARRQNKWMGGIEDMDDQRGYLDQMIGKEDIREALADDGPGSAAPELSNLINLYLAQDLEGVDAYSNIGRGGQPDSVMVRRNHKMAGRIDSLSAIRSTVFAVGVAHLPGREGLIRLLRDRGLQIEPVFSDKKIPTSSYHFLELPVAWQDVRDSGSRYEVSMPGKPANIKMFGILDMKMYVDIFNSSGFMTAGFMSGYTGKRQDSVIDKMAMGVFHTQTPKPYTPISLQGARGRVYIGRDDEGYKKFVVFVKQNMMWIVSGTLVKESPASKKDLDRFFASFRMLAEPSHSAVHVHQYVDSAAGYRVDVPGEVSLLNLPAKISDGAKEKWDLTLHQAMDLTAGRYYLFAAGLSKPGFLIKDDSSFMAGVKKNAISKLKSLSFDTTWVAGDRRISEIHGKMNQLDMDTYTRYIVRGNRWYSLVFMQQPSKSSSDQIDSAADSFFGSFSLLDFAAPHWHNQTAPDSIFTAWAPADWKDMPIDSTENGSFDKQYNSYDRTHSDSYLVMPYHLDRWYWSNSDSAFWAKRVSGHLRRTDSLLYKKAVTNGDAIGWEWVKYPANAEPIEFVRQRALLYGDKIYLLMSNGRKEDIMSPEADRFFTSFRFNRPIPRTHFFESKAPALLEALFDKDSATAAKALEYVRSAPFEKKDVPVLLRALYKTDSLSDEHKSIQWALKREIMDLRDSSVFDSVSKRYLQIPDTLLDSRNSLLEIMTANPTQSHFAKFADLLRKSPPAGDLSYQVVSHLHNNLPLTTQVMPSLLPLIKDSLVSNSILQIAQNLLDSGLLDKQLLTPYENEILRNAEKEIRRQRMDSDVYSRFNAALITAMGALNTIRSNATLQKFFTLSKSYIWTQALEALLKNNQEPPAKVYLSLASDKSYRLDLYKTLDHAGKMTRFPKIWLTQPLLGESIVYNYLSEEYDGVVTAINLVGSRLHADSTGRQKRYYFFRYKSDEEEQPYLSCVGPFDPDPAKVDPGSAHVYFYFRKPYNPKNAVNQINDLLKAVLKGENVAYED